MREPGPAGPRRAGAARSWIGVALVLAAAGVWVIAWLVVGRSGQGVLALAPVLATLSGLVLLPVVLVARTTRWRVVAGVTSVVLLLPLLPLVALTVHQSPLPEQDLRLLEWNAQDAPGAVAALEQLTADESPDLVVVAQVNQAGMDASKTLGQRFPYRADNEAPGSADYVVLLSRYPIVSSSVVERTGDGPPLRALVAAVDLPDGPLTIVTAHPTRPLLGDRTGYGAVRDEQLEQLAEVVRAAQAAGSTRVLAAGDFNVTTRESAYRELLSSTGLVDAVDWPRWSAVGTWRPTSRGVPGILPLDHVLHSPCLGSTGLTTTWRTSGSQHAPLLTTLRSAC